MRFQRFGVVLQAVFLSAAGVVPALPVSASPDPDPSHECGQISTDVTWTPEHSPYVLDCNVLVPDHVTLTIQPGVTVDTTGGRTLQVGGSLVANGSAAEPIIFFGAKYSFSGQAMVSFVENAPFSSSISYADFSGADYAALVNYPGTNLSHVSFHDNPNFAMDGYMGAALTISDSSFRDNGIGISVFATKGTLAIRNTEITDNRDKGIWLRSVDSADIHINQNNIHDNGHWNVDAFSVGTSRPTVDGTNNWWGSTDPMQIQAKIHDCDQDLTAPCLSFRPYLVGPNYAAGTPPIVTTVPSPTATETLVPAPTLTPTEIASPTTPPTPTHTPIPTATPTNTQSPVPTSTPSPTLGIDKLVILHTVKGKKADTRQLHVGERAEVVVAYHASSTGAVRLVPEFNITRSGKQIFTTTLHPYTYGGLSAFHASMRLGRATVGNLYIHVRLRLGSAFAKRDRKLRVTT